MVARWRTRKGLCWGRRPGNDVKNELQKMKEKNVFPSFLSLSILHVHARRSLIGTGFDDGGRYRVGAGFPPTTRVRGCCGGGARPDTGATLTAAAAAAARRASSILRSRKRDRSAGPSSARRDRRAAISDRRAAASRSRGGGGGVPAPTPCSTEAATTAASASTPSTTPLRAVSGVVRSSSGARASPTGRGGGRRVVRGRRAGRQRRGRGRGHVLAPLHHQVDVDRTHDGAWRRARGRGRRGCSQGGGHGGDGAGGKGDGVSRVCRAAAAAAARAQHGGGGGGRVRPGVIHGDEAGPRVVEGGGLRKRKVGRQNARASGGGGRGRSHAAPSLSSLSALPRAWARCA